MKKTISIVVPMYNESATIALFFKAINEVISGISKYFFEVLVVNDGSTDDTHTLLETIYSQYSYVSIINLSRNFGHEAALAAGLSKAVGEAVIVMDADLQDPPNLIGQLIDKWEEGYEIINARRIDRRNDSFFKRKSAEYYYNLMNKFSNKVKIPNNVGNYRLLSRKVVNEINSLPEKNRVFRILVPYVGYKTTTIDFTREKRINGVSHYNLKSMSSLATNSFTSLTTAPLKWAVVIGCLSLISGLIGLIVLLIFRNLTGLFALGSLILFISGIQLLFLGIIGIYLGQLFNEVKNRPVFIIDKYFPAKKIKE